MYNWNSAEGIMSVVEMITKEMQKGEFEQKLRASLDQKSVGVIDSTLLKELESLQVALLDALGYPGAVVLEEMKGCVHKYDGNEQLRQTVVRLCDTEEFILEKISADIARKHGLPTNHHPDPHQMQMMQMSMQSLSEAQRNTLATIQHKMMTGQVPTAEEQRAAFEIRQHIQAYMMTMEQMMTKACQEQSSQP